MGDLVTGMTPNVQPPKDEEEEKREDQAKNTDLATDDEIRKALDAKDAMIKALTKERDALQKQKDDAQNALVQALKNLSGSS